MGTSVGDYLVVKTKVEEDFMKEEVGDSFCGDGFLGRIENHPLSKSMIDHDQERVKAGGEGKVGDKITGDLLEQVGGSQVDRGEGQNGGMHVELVLLANCTPFDILAYKRCQTRPPEFGGDQLMGFQVAWVACSFVVVATSEDGPSERGVRGDVNMTFVSEDPLGVLPVRQMGTEGWRNGSVHGL